MKHVIAPGRSSAGQASAEQAPGEDEQTAYWIPVIAHGLTDL